MFNVNKIKSFLLENPDYFNDETQATSIHDILHFKVSTPKNIMFINDYFICDIYSGELWIVQVLKSKKYDPIRKKKLEVKAVVKIMSTKDENGTCFFSRFNGYWLIPELKKN
jgi:hypothetical protein